MKKRRVNNFINKYHLSGLVESVKWEIEDNTLQTSFISDDKSCLGKVALEDFDFENSTFGVYTTSDLSKMLGILDEDVELRLDRVGDTLVSISLSDGSVDTNFMLSDLAVIPNVPKSKAMPDWDVQVTLEPEFITRFSKALSALSDSDVFTLVYDDANDGYNIVLGYSNINSNRISIAVESKFEKKIQPISFSARYFREILNANKEANSFTFKVSEHGLSHIKFELDDYTSEYYLIAIKNV